MKIIACMPARNEDWCLGLSLRAVLMWADAVVVLDHASTDDTARIIQEVDLEHPGRVFGLAVPEPTWLEMAHRQAMLQFARAGGATHIAIVDADEVLSGNLLGHIRTMILSLGADQLLQLPWTCLARSVDRYYTEGVWGTNWVTCAFPDKPEYGWRQRDGYDFHHRHPMGANPFHSSRPVAQGQGGLMHLQFVSERRLRAKQANYLITEMLRWPGRQSVEALNAMYGRAVYESDPATVAHAACPAEWWAPYDHLMQYLRVDAEPWQEKAVRKAVLEHGRARFQGLDLFGVA